MRCQENKINNIGIYIAARINSWGYTQNCIIQNNKCISYRLFFVNLYCKRAGLNSVFCGNYRECTFASFVHGFRVINVMTQLLQSVV